MLCDNAPLIVRQFGHNIVSPKFPAALSFSFPYFFPYDSKNIEHLINLVNSNAALREPLIIFVAIMVSLST